MTDDKIAEIKARHSKRTEIHHFGGYLVDGCTWWGSLTQTQTDLATLLAEVERLRADAMRYRWLKSRKELAVLSGGTQWYRPDGSTFVASHSLSADGTLYGFYETLDETIDRAMEGAP